MSESDPLAWVERAEQDYATAKSALRRKKPFTYVACFHAQQYLKALLVAARHPFSQVHDLLILSDECERAGIFLSLSEDALSILSIYAVRVCYPGDDPTPEEAREAPAIARAARRVARKFLNIV